MPTETIGDHRWVVPTAAGLGSGHEHEGAVGVGAVVAAEQLDELDVLHLQGRQHHRLRPLRGASDDRPQGRPRAVGLDSMDVVSGG